MYLKKLLGHVSPPQSSSIVHLLRLSLSQILSLAPLLNTHILKNMFLKVLCGLADSQSTFIYETSMCNHNIFLYQIHYILDFLSVIQFGMCETFLPNVQVHGQFFQKFFTQSQELNCAILLQCENCTPHQVKMKIKQC